MKPELASYSDTVCILKTWQNYLPSDIWPWGVIDSGEGLTMLLRRFRNVSSLFSSTMPSSTFDASWRNSTSSWAILTTVLRAGISVSVWPSKVAPSLFTFSWFVSIDISSSCSLWRSDSLLLSFETRLWKSNKRCQLQNKDFTVWPDY